MGLALVFAGCCLVIAFFVPAVAQNIKYTKNTVDQSLRSNIRIDPATLRMNFSVQLPDYQGRGLSLPVSLNYASKVWRMELRFTNLVTGTSMIDAKFAEHSTSGWTSSLDVPVVEHIGPTEPYRDNGQSICEVCNPPPTATRYYINRLLIHMPGGSTHELRKNDTAMLSVTLAGIYEAVDGSRLKYDADNRIIYLPNGSRYLLGTGFAGSGTQYVDRSGNTLSYNHPHWTDTLGRVINQSPMNNTAAGDYTNTMPGVGGSPLNYVFRWRNLADVRTDPSQPLRYTGNYSSQFGGISPSLFHGEDGSSVVFNTGLSLFNPVVLWQIELPNGSKYTFTYNIYGEIDKIQLPTGGYERFEYGEVVGISSSLDVPYSETNRGVIKHWISNTGSSSDEVLWQYSASFVHPSSNKTIVTAPDNSRVEHYLHRGVAVGSSVTFGFENVRVRRIYDERVYSPANQLLRRTLTEWTYSGSLPGASGPATRDARIAKKVEILLDTGGNALAETTTMSYDADLNVIATNSFGYVSVDSTTAQTSDINTIPIGTLLRVEEVTYLINDTSIAQANRDAYRARRLLALPTQTFIKDSAGAVVAATIYGYDESTYAPLAYSGTIPGWTDPGTTARGNVTTLQMWSNFSSGALQTYPSGSFIAIHMQPDQCGNIRRRWDPKGNVTEIFYDDAFSDGVARNTFAFPTRMESPVPDPSGSYGTNQKLTTSSTYDYHTSKVVKKKDVNDRETFYTYYSANLLNRLQKITYSDGGETSYEYGDIPGSVFFRELVKQDAVSHLDDYTFYDGLGRTIESRKYEPGSTYSTVRTAYDALGRVSTVSNPYRPGEPLLWTTTDYDTLGRVTRVTTPDGAQVNTQYSGNQVTVTDQAGKKRRGEIDALGRVIKVTEDPGGLGFDTTYEYDALDNLRHVQQGIQERWFAYDSLSRLIRAKHPEQDVNPNLSYTDPLTGNNGWSTAYSYDATGNLASKTDARNITTTYTYDTLNRNTLIDYSNTTTVNPDIKQFYDGAINGKGRFWYDYAGGDLTNGQNVEHTAIDSYDPLGRRLIKRQVFKHNGIWGSTYSINQAYDLAGNVKTVTYPSGRTVNYNYDNAGRLHSLTGNLGDGVNRNYATDIQYDAAGLMKREQFGTTIPLYHRRHYNNRRQVFDIRLGTDPNPSYDSDDLTAWANAAGSWNRGALRLYYATSDGCHVYGDGGMDNNGNLLRMDHHIPIDDAVSNFVMPIHRYTYDPLDRLQNVIELTYTKDPSGQDVYQGVFRQAFIYDRWGNRTIDQGNTTGAVNRKAYLVDVANNNRLKPPPGSGTMHYDQAGNLDIDDYTSGAFQQFSYDAKNRIVEVHNSIGSLMSRYVYDASGQRVRRIIGGQETWQVYGMEEELLAEYAAGAAPSAAQKEYGYRNEELLVTWDSGGTGDRKLQWLVQDHLGSARLAVDRSGSLAGVRRHDYLPFGEELFAGVGIRSSSKGYSDDSVRQKFTSKERDNETGLDYFINRYYSSIQGRFTSVDPENLQAIVMSLNPQSWGGYSYVNNNPLNAIDPDGTMLSVPQDVIEKIKNKAKYGLYLTDKELQRYIDEGRNILYDAAVMEMIPPYTPDQIQHLSPELVIELVQQLQEALKHPERMRIDDRLDPPGPETSVGAGPYRENFNKSRVAQGKKELPTEYDAHHRIPQAFRGHKDFKNFNFDAPSNIRGVPGNRKLIGGRNIHQEITNMWEAFRRASPNATKRQIENFARKIDTQFSKYYFK